MIRMEVQEGSLKEIERKLGNLDKNGRTVLKKAVNETAKSAKRALAIKAKNTYTVKKANFNAEMKITSAKVGAPEAIITAAGEPLPLINYKVSAGKKGTKVQVLKQGSLKELKYSRGDIKAFVNNIAKKGQVRKRDTAKGAKGSAVIHKAVAQREGEARLSINEKFGNSIPAMLASKKVFGEEQDSIRNMLKENLYKHIKQMMEG